MARRKIAILGGGAGAMTAAFYLTCAPDWRERYDIAVYQLGWRLGGKGASGRNRAAADRIEEHGLHLFLGFYANAFATMQAVYRELGRPAGAPFARWDEVWQPHSYFVLEEAVGDRVEPWPFEFARNTGVPGEGGELPSPWQMLQTALGRARAVFETTAAQPARPSVALDQLDAIIAGAASALAAASSGAARIDPTARPAPRDLASPIGALRRWLGEAASALAGLPDALFAGAFLHAAVRHAERQPADAAHHSRRDHEILISLLRAFIAWLKAHWASAARTEIAVRRALIEIDLTIAACVGMIVDGLLVPPVDWFKIDGARFEDWLIRHGAERASVESPPIALLSELVFARRTGVGAGTALHYALRMLFGYKGAFAYRMQVGMGEAVFAPLYQVLSARGVRFEFFHAVESLGTGRDASGAPVIDAVEIAVQAETVDGAPYRPLVEIGGVPCWPSAPLHDQLVRGGELERSGENLENWWTSWPAARARTLRRGADFDEVVLGISIGAYPYVCRQLIAEMPAFARMVEAVQVTETQSAQLWMSRDLAALGWSLGPEPVIGTYGEPFDTIADMSHLLARETWPSGTAASVLYLTSVATGDAPPATPPRTAAHYPLDQRAAVAQNLERWLRARISGLFPAATGPGGELDWSALVDPAQRTGRDRLAAQYWTSSWNPSDRYVLSVPGSVSARLPSAGTGYRNLVMAGDWTRTALSAGCVEAAVMSGMHAARALCGVPARIAGDDLPDGDDGAHRELAPRYIELDGNATPLAPYTAHDVTMYSFLLEADIDRLRALCDQQLCLGGPIEYRPVGPFAFFVAATIGGIAPVSPAAWTSEQDFGFWIPVLAGRRGPGGAFHPERAAFYLPYIWVDEYLAAQAGREVFGYAKGVGRLAAPATPDAASRESASISIDAFVVPELGPPGAPASRWQWRRLVTARRAGESAGGTPRTFGTIAELGRAAASVIARDIGEHALPLPSLALLRSLARDAAALEVPMVFLKQFRDAADGRAACYQAIIESSNRVTSPGVELGLLGGDWDLAIEQFASVRLIDQLGLRTRGGRIRSAFHFWARFAFTTEPGREIWRAV